MALITAASVREQVLRSISGTGEDTKIETMIAQVNDLFARYVGMPRSDAGTWTMESATYTLFLDRPSLSYPSKLELRIRPVIAITSAAIDTTGDWSYSTTIASGDRTTDLERGELWLNPDATDAWLVGPRSNKIVLTAGYATTPPSLAALAAQQVGFMWTRNPAGVENANVGGQSVSRAELARTIPNDIRSGLAPYVMWEAHVA